MSHLPARGLERNSGGRRWSIVSRAAFAVMLVAMLGSIAPAASAVPIVVPNADDGGSGSGNGSLMTVNRLFSEVFTGQKGEVCAELMTIGALHQTPAGQFLGPEGFNEFVSTIWTAFPDAVFAIDEISVSGSTVAVRWSMTGTNLGPLDGAAATGNAVSLHGLALFGFDGERIATSWIEYDRLGLVEQVNAQPSLPATCSRCEETP